MLACIFLEPPFPELLDPPLGRLRFFKILAREYWKQQGLNEINKAKQLKPNIGVAKNVIIFLGDGMGISTVTSARILKGQLQNKTGEETVLSFETFPHVGLSKVIINIIEVLSDLKILLNFQN